MRSGWRWWWKVWALVGIVAELVSLRIGTPLTGVARRYVLGTPWGSMIAGAFLGWLPYHWLWVSEGLGPGDLAALILGAAAGGLGWHVRHPPGFGP